jgi:hypothetical protein
VLPVQKLRKEVHPVPAGKWIPPPRGRQQANCIPGFILFLNKFTPGCSVPFTDHSRFKRKINQGKPAKPGNNFGKFYLQESLDLFSRLEPVGVKNTVKKEKKTQKEIFTSIKNLRRGCPSQQDSNGRSSPDLLRLHPHRATRDSAGVLARLQFRALSAATQDSGSIPTRLQL